MICKGFFCRTSAFPDSKHVPILYSLHNSGTELRVNDGFQRIKEELIHLNTITAECIHAVVSCKFDCDALGTRTL